MKKIILNNNIISPLVKEGPGEIETKKSLSSSVWVGLTLFFLLISISLPLLFGFGKTGKNTTVLGHDYSLLSKKEIIAKLSTDFPISQNIELKINDRSFSLDPASISAQVDSNATANSLLFRRLNQGVGKYFEAFFQPKEFPLLVSYDLAKLNSYLQDIASQIDQPFVPSEVVVGPALSIKDGQIGQSLDQPKLANQIIASLTNYSFAPLDIPVIPVGSLPTDDQKSQLLSSAQKLVGKSLILSDQGNNTTLADKDLITWLSFTDTCRVDRIQNYSEVLAKNVAKDPLDAVFKFEDGKVLEFQPQRKGQTLDSARFEAEICPQISSLISSTEKTLTYQLPLIYTDPKITNSEVNNLGIKELLGRGSSTFSHSTAIRNHNVEKGASIVNRVLVAPDEVFSFIKNLGEVTLDNGYKQAYVIRAGKTELDVGGGICQVSTTLFRAILNSGLYITERKNHAYRVGYYEEDMPPGYDATVFIPNPDLKFKNDTGHHLLIQSIYDGVNKKLTYEIYGTSDGRQVEISNYRQWDATPAPPDVYIDDPTLPAGKVVKDESRVPGLKTSFEWKVTRNGEVLHQKTFQSSYAPWAAVYRRGPIVQ